MTKSVLPIRCLAISVGIMYVTHQGTEDLIPLSNSGTVCFSFYLDVYGYTECSVGTSHPPLLQGRNDNAEGICISNYKYEL